MRIRFRDNLTEEDLVDGYNFFLIESTKILAGGDIHRQTEFRKNRKSAATGIVAKRKGSRSSKTLEIDEDAGVRGATDFQVAFGHSCYEGKTLLAGEAKFFFGKRPNMTRPWQELKPNHLPEVMQSMVGKMATFTIAVCDFGMKSFLVRPNSDGATSSIFMSPPGPCYLDFAEEGAWDLVFDWWLEIAALAVRPRQQPGKIQAQGMTVATTISDNSSNSSRSPRKRQRTNSPDSQSPPKKQLIVKGLTGHVIRFTGIDFGEILTPEESHSLDETFEKERKEEVEREEALHEAAYPREAVR